MTPPRTPGIPSDVTLRRLPTLHGEVTVIEFLDRRLIDAAHIEQLGQQLKAIASETPTPRLVVSFEKVEYLSSTALNVLIELDNLIRQKKGQFRIANLAPELMKVFTLMKLHKVMKICDTTDEAVKSIKG